MPAKELVFLLDRLDATERSIYRCTTNPIDREEAIRRALEDINAGHLSQRQAEATYGIPRSTLHGRLDGRQDYQTAHVHEQLLSEAQEDEIVAWCDEMERRFLPARLSHIWEYGEAILEEQHGPNAHITLGEHWDQRFRKRHPELRVTTSKQIDEKRVMSRNPSYIMDFYVKLSNTYQRYSIPVRNIFNCDEKGFWLGVSGRELVVIMRRSSDKPRDGYAGGSKQPGSRENITVIECIGADGTVLPPFIIMKGINVQKRWSENSPLPKSTRWACSPSGWTDNELGIEYIQAFHEWTVAKSANGQWRCLIVDGHGSHVTYGFLKYAIDHRIIVVGLPSHTADFLQPLDRGLFRPLQMNYGREVRRRMGFGQLVTKDTFAEVLHYARERTYTEKNIISAFESAGISPLNAWRTLVMSTHRLKLQAGEKSKASNPEVERQRKKRNYLDAVSDPDATTEELRAALTEAISVIDGVEARIALQNLELSAAREEIRVRRTCTVRGGRVGKARVYSQAEIEEIREQEEARLAAAANSKARGRGRGGSRARGAARGKGQVRGQSRKAEMEDAMEKDGPSPSGSSTSSTVST